MKIKKLLSLSLLTQLLFLTPLTAYANPMTDSKEVTVNVNAQNSLELKISTNTINFNEYNGTKDFTEDLELTVNSSLNYDVKVKMNEELTSTTYSDRIVDRENISIYEIDSSERTFENLDVYYPLIEDSIAGKNKIHNVTFKLKGDSSVIEDNYKTEFTFEAIQK